MDLEQLVDILARFYSVTEFVYFSWIGLLISCLLSLSCTLRHLRTKASAGKFDMAMQELIIYLLSVRSMSDYNLSLWGDEVSTFFHSNYLPPQKSREQRCEE